MKSDIFFFYTERLINGWCKRLADSNNIFFYDDILATILSIQIEDLFLTLCLVKLAHF